MLSAEGRRRTHRRLEGLAARAAQDREKGRTALNMRKIKIVAAVTAVALTAAACGDGGDSGGGDGGG